MAPFFMRQTYVMTGSIVGLIIANAFIGSATLTALCLILILLYAELRAHDVKKLTEEKEKKMGNRLIEGLKALTDVCHNAFDHLKTHKQLIDKINGRLGDHSGKIHQLNRRHNSMAGQRSKEEGSKGQTEAPQRNTRQSQAPRKSSSRTDRTTERAHEVVPNTERLSGKDNVQ